MIARLKSRQGVTLIELLVYAGLFGLVAYWAADFLKIPTPLNRFYQQSHLERNLEKALEPMENDLREGKDFQNIAMKTLSLGAPPLEFQKSRINSDLSQTNWTIAYEIKTENSLETLVRTVNGAQPQNLFSVATPAATLQLVFEPPTNSTPWVDIILSQTLTGTTPIVTHSRRRVALRS